MPTFGTKACGAPGACEMAAANHRRQHRLAVVVDGKAFRLAHDIHQELIGAAGDVCVKLDLRQEHRRDAAAVPVGSGRDATGRGRSVRRGGRR